LATDTYTGSTSPIALPACMLVVSWPFWGVASTCGVALIGGEATAQPARQASISNTMRRAVVSPSPLSKKFHP
jgi:hypothetical protein